MPTANKYNVQMHGGENGYHGYRAIVRLKQNTTAVAYIYFIPEGNPIPNDDNSGRWIKMYMPESALPSVVDLIRNESPIIIYFAAGSGFLKCGEEDVGEEDD